MVVIVASGFFWTSIMSASTCGLAPSPELAADYWGASLG